MRLTSLESPILQPRFAKSVPDADAGASQYKGFSFFGSSSPPSDPPRQEEEARAEPDAKDGFTLNFENSPVSNVAKVVLGDIMGVGYVIDSRAQGTITLSSGRPIAKRDMLFVLENALRANNLAMLREGAGYRIAPIGDGGVGPLDRSGGASAAEPGYGLTVIPLQYVSGATLTKLLEGFAARPGAIRTDPSGKILLIVGTGSERQIRARHGAQLRRRLAARAIGRDVSRAQQRRPSRSSRNSRRSWTPANSGLGHGMVKFQGDRAAERDPGRRREAGIACGPPLAGLRGWTSRNAASAGVKVYKVRYGDAKQIAQLLSEIFVHGAPGGSADSATNQIAPSSGGGHADDDRASDGRQTDQSVGRQTAAPAASSAERGDDSRSAGIPTAAAEQRLRSRRPGRGGRRMLPGVRITADTANNSLLIYANARKLQVIERTLNQLDRPRLQVAIDVTIAEVTLERSTELRRAVLSLEQAAVSSISAASIHRPSPTILPPTRVTARTAAASTCRRQHRDAARHHQRPARADRRENPLQSVAGRRRQRQATLEVGDQVPVSTGSATVLSANNAVVNTVDYKNTGIILHVLPRVNPDENVLLDIEQEISSVPRQQPREPDADDLRAQGQEFDFGHKRADGHARRPRSSDTQNQFALGHTGPRPVAHGRRRLRQRPANRRRAPSSSFSSDRRSSATAPTPRRSPSSFARRCEAARSTPSACRRR